MINLYVFDITMGSAFGLMFFVVGLSCGPMLSYFLQPLRQHIEPSTKQNVLYGVPSIFYFCFYLISALALTIFSFFLKFKGLTVAPEPEPIGVLFFAVRYGTGLLLGGMLVAHLLLKHSMLVRKFWFSKQEQIAADLYGN